ncbi:MAG: hypothetical protein U9Q83_10185 [Bacteroidota bacterium]|nr:hypothetical protein [Bacteroidota bacterium]
MGFILQERTLLIAGLILFIVNIVFTVNVVKRVEGFFKRLISLLFIWLLPIIGIGAYLVLVNKTTSKERNLD